MYVAKPSFSQMWDQSSHVKRLPNHWWAASWATSEWDWSYTSRNRFGGNVRKKATCYYEDSGAFIGLLFDNQLLYSDEVYRRVKQGAEDIALNYEAAVAEGLVSHRHLLNALTGCAQRSAP